MRQIVLASGNPGKISELKALLSPLGWQVLTKPSELEIEETGATFYENARIKALGVARETGLPALADDSGLEVEVLDGAPGVYSARWGTTDDARIARLLAAMAGCRDRRARFVCAIVLVDGQGNELVAVEGECTGEILEAPRGSGGFGYDPVFLVSELNQTFAELSTEQKATVSHRGRAMAKLVAAMRALGW